MRGSDTFLIVFCRENPIRLGDKNYLSFAWVEGGGCFFVVKTGWNVYIQLPCWILEAGLWRTSMVNRQLFSILYFIWTLLEDMLLGGAFNHSCYFIFTQKTREDFCHFDWCVSTGWQRTSTWVSFEEIQLWDVWIFTKHTGCWLRNMLFVCSDAVGFESFKPTDLQYCIYTSTDSL